MSSAPALYDEEAVRHTGWRSEPPTPYAFAEDPLRQIRKDLIDVVAQIESLALLGPNWDDDFSPAVDGVAIERAKWFTENLAVPWLPLVGATTVGGVRVEWDAENAFLIIDFEPHGETQVMFRPIEGDVQVWRNEEIPGGLEYCYAEVNRARQGQ